MEVKITMLSKKSQRKKGHTLDISIDLKFEKM